MPFLLKELDPNQAFSLGDFFSMANMLIVTLQKKHGEKKSFPLTVHNVVLGQQEDSTWIAKVRPQKVQTFLDISAKEFAVVTRVNKICDLSMQPQNQKSYLALCYKDYYNQDYYQLTTILEHLLCHCPANTEVKEIVNTLVSELQAFRIRSDRYQDADTTEALTILTESLANIQNPKIQNNQSPAPKVVHHSKAFLPSFFNHWNPFKSKSVCPEYVSVNPNN